MGKKQLKKQSTARLKGNLPAGHKSLPSSDICPSWRFKRLYTAQTENFPMPTDAKTILEIADSLKAYEKQTLSELFSGDRHNHYAVYNLEKCKDHLHEDILAYMQKYQFEEIHRFRIGKAKRVYAVCVDYGVFELTWWDPHHIGYSTSE